MCNGWSMSLWICNQRWWLSDLWMPWSMSGN